jgi:hypothetical protein
VDHFKIKLDFFLFPLNTEKQRGAVKGDDRQGNSRRHSAYTSLFTAGMFAISCVPRLTPEST